MQSLGAGMHACKRVDGGVLRTMTAAHCPRPPTRPQEECQACLEAINGARSTVVVAGAGTPARRRRSLLSRVPMPQFMRRRLAQFAGDFEGPTVGVAPEELDTPEGNGQLDLLTEANALVSECQAKDPFMEEPFIPSFIAPPPQPLAVDDEYTCAANKPCTPPVLVVANDSSPNAGAVLNVTLDTPPPNGTVTLYPNGTFTFVPPP